MRKNILITGGAGFIGSHIADKLCHSYNVTVVDDLSGGDKINVNDACDLIEGDVSDAVLISKLFKLIKFDYVFHLAAYAAEGLSHFIRKFNYTNNLIGSVNIINECIKHEVKCLVFTSSIAVYGKNQLPMKEDLTPHPEDPYGIAKYAVELDIRAAHEMFGLNYIIFRPFNVFGERQNINDKYRNVIGIFINQILSGKPLTIFGDGAQIRAFTYIDDISSIMADSIFVKNAYNNTFNIGSDKFYTVNKLAEIVKKTINPDAEIIYHNKRKEVDHAYCDISKIQEYILNIKYTPLECGIKNMVKWARASKIKKPESFKNIEIEKNLPESWRS